MENIFDKHTFENLQNRIQKLSEDTQAQWGKMNAGQMAFHCQGPLNIILKKNDYELKPNWLVNIFFKKTLWSDKPYRKNLPTIKPFKVLDQKNFNEEKSNLISLINELGSQPDDADFNPHPAFGNLSREQWGKMQFNHLDHHFRQFGI